MDFRRFQDTYYVRLDRGDEIISSLLDICRREGIRSATFSGIGGCETAEIQTFLPEKGEFETRVIRGALELISMMGNIVTDDEGTYFHHTHALYSWKDEEGQHQMASGHMKASRVLYTAEMELRPVLDGRIGRKYDKETGTGFWDLTK